ncbi:MAG: TrkA family potassium uptake protein [Opitutae bacterium]|nr:TrkA family potassium uptake protein [Opitutae bacterium]
MKFAIVGIGDFGRAAALGLARAGVDVIAVDNDMDRLDTIKGEVALALRIDAAQSGALATHGLNTVDVLVATIGKNFEAQALVVVHAKQLGIKRVVARALTDDHRRILEAVGADLVFNPEEEAARAMVQRLTIPNIKNYFELADGFNLVEIAAPPGIVGKSLQQLRLRQDHRLNLIAIKRERNQLSGWLTRTEIKAVPQPEDIIQAGDIVALVGSVRDLRKFVDAFTR